MSQGAQDAGSLERVDAPKPAAASFHAFGLDQSQTSFPVRKPVNTLAIVPREKRISLITRKMFNVMLHYAQKQGLEDAYYRLPFRYLADTIEFNSNNYEVIKEHLREMVSTIIEWQSPTPGEGANWSVSGLIAHAELITSRGELFIEWSYARNMKQEMLDPQRYAKISLHIQKRLKTAAALALYENCFRYVDNPGGLTARQPWQWWRPVLTGTALYEGNTHPEYKYFKRDVVKPAINEVVMATDIDVSLVEHKAGRAVIDIQFTVARKANVASPAPQRISVDDLKIIGTCLKAGISQDKAERFLEEFGLHALQAALHALAARQANTALQPIRQPEQFLRALLKSGNFGKEKETILQPPARLDTKASRLALIEDFRSRKLTELEMIFKEMLATDQQDWLQRFASGNLPAAMKRTYEQKGLGSPMTRIMFLKYLGQGMWGDGWDVPNDTELLELAIHRSKTP